MRRTIPTLLLITLLATSSRPALGFIESITPLANLFVTLAQRMGVETDRFGSSTAAGVRGLETL